MEHKNPTEETRDYRETVCSIQCDALIRENQSALDQYLQFCSTRLVLPILNFNDKQLHLFGSMTANTEAGRMRLYLVTRNLRFSAYFRRKTVS